MSQGSAAAPVVEEVEIVLYPSLTHRSPLSHPCPTFVSSNYSMLPTCYSPGTWYQIGTYLVPTWYLPGTYLVLIDLFLQNQTTFSKVDIVDFSNLYAIKTSTGKYFFCDKHTYGILSGLDVAPTKTALHRYYKKHYEGKKFPSVITNPPDSEHVCTFVNHSSGKSLRAFSIAGLEFLCNNITGKAADENRPKFLKLIQTFKASIAAPRSPSPAAALGGRADEQQDLGEPGSPSNRQMVSMMRSLLPIQTQLTNLVTLVTYNENSRFETLVESMKSATSAQAETIQTLRSSLDSTRESKNAIQNQLDISNTKVQDQGVMIARLNARLDNSQKEIDQLKETQHAIGREQNLGNMPMLLHQKGEEITNLRTKNEQQRFILRKLNVDLDNTKAERDAALSESRWLREEAMPELKRENKRLKRELDDWTGMATAEDRDSQ